MKTKLANLSFSLNDLLGAEYLKAVIEARALTEGVDRRSLARLADEKVDFYPEAFQKRVDELEAASKAAANKARAQKLMRKLEKAGMSFASDEDKEQELGRLAPSGLSPAPQAQLRAPAPGRRARSADRLPPHRRPMRPCAPRRGAAARGCARSAGAERTVS